MLALWTGGQVDNGTPPRHGRWHSLATLALVCALAALTVVLAKYAIDVLSILLMMAAFGLVLHIVGTRLAEANLLNIGPILIFLFGAGLFAYAFVAPSTNFDALAQKAPAPVIRFLEWSESHGWAQTAIVSSSRTTEAGGGSAGQAPVEPETAAPSPISVVLPATPPVAGQPVVLRAQLAAGSFQKEVRFYDGSALLGVGEVRAEGDRRVADLTVTAFTAGQHDIRVEATEWLGLRTLRSAPVTLTVK